jgi:NDP-sugar pyrophosphorylase family protein
MKQANNISIVIPMGGLVTPKFKEAGFVKSKPFTDIKGKTLIERVMENVSLPDAKFILVVHRRDLDSSSDVLTKINSKFSCDFISLDRPTDGAAYTVLQAKSFINNENPLLIVNCDHLIDEKLEKFVEDANARNLDGSVLTFPDPERKTKGCFVELGPEGFVSRTREKKAISQIAAVGIYWYKKGSFFVEAAEKMIAAKDLDSKVFYVGPACNYMLKNSRKIGAFSIEAAKMHGLSTPEDLQKFINSGAT